MQSSQQVLTQQTVAALMVRLFALQTGQMCDIKFVHYHFSDFFFFLVLKCCYDSFNYVESIDSNNINFTLDSSFKQEFTYLHVPYLKPWLRLACGWLPLTLTCECRLVNPVPFISGNIRLYRVCEKNYVVKRIYMPSFADQWWLYKTHIVQIVWTVNQFLFGNNLNVSPLFPSKRLFWYIFEEGSHVMLHLNQYRFSKGFKNCLHFLTIVYIYINNTTV